MPPEGKPLSQQQVADLRSWVADGAFFPSGEKLPPAVRSGANHWSFRPLQSVLPDRSTLRHSAWVRNPIDLFVLARLEEQGLSPSVPAAPETLIRRASLDLTGLPPRPEQVQAFCQNPSAEAYEKVIDRLLASPHYGERWARHWLDLARYADSHGYTIDGPRSIWLWRDWVIKALNDDMPFDRFTIEQIAGDMLPGASTDSVIATGFHRNTLINQEGGTDGEQFRVEAVADRVNTTATVWLGLTLGCARCHDHKYDPLSQREYYQFFSLLNNCEEPTIRVPSRQQQEQFEKLGRELAAAHQTLAKHDNARLDDLEAWIERLAQAQPASWRVLQPLMVASAAKSKLTTLADHSVLAQGPNPPKETYTVRVQPGQKTITAIRLEVLTDPSLPHQGPGRAPNGNFVLSELTVSPVHPPAKSTRSQPGQPKTSQNKISQNKTQQRELDHHKPEQPKGFKNGSAQLTIRNAIADHSQPNYPVKGVIDGDLKTGWAINTNGKGKLNVDRGATFVLARPLQLAAGDQLQIRLVQHHLPGGGSTIGRFRLSFTTAPAEVVEVSAGVLTAAKTPADELEPAQEQLLVDAFRAGDPQRAQLQRRVEEIEARRHQLGRSVATTMVLKERSKPRKTFVHIRGDFTREGTPVQPGTPSVLPPIRLRAENSSGQPDRLDLATWLVQADNPLTPRVTVNRVWMRYFGKGLVATENDLGTQGELPTHPELLDWLAGEFIREGWSLKKLHKLIVTSATYRQSSRFRAKLTKADPQNKLLGRQNRLRLSAEIIRDSALVASGLLHPALGGPSVYPPQPPGLDRFTQNRKSWPTSQGPARYRRGLYIYYWRSSPYPFLTTFDSPNANTTCTRRLRSNTPLQALTLANDQAFLEFAQGLALRVLHEVPGRKTASAQLDQAAGTSAKTVGWQSSEPSSHTPARSLKDQDHARLTRAFCRCLVRSPTPQEIRRLREFLQTQRAAFAKTPQEAQKLAPKDLPLEIDPVEAAAWVSTARVLLNLDEFVTRE